MSFNQGFCLFVFLMVIIACCCCCCSVPKLCLILCNPMHCRMLCFSVLQNLSEFAQIHVYWVGDAIQPFYLLLPTWFLPSIFLGIRVSSKESALPIKWPKYWSLNISISPSKEYSRLISFRIYWFDLLAVQGTLENLLQHHNLKASVLQYSAFFMV